MPVHLFLNPTAGRGRAARRQQRILELFAEGGVEVELANSDSVGDLEEKVRAAALGGADRIVVAGGDGTVHEATNGVITSGTGVALGLIPTGTGNDFAKACDIPLDWEHATRLLVDRLKANQAPHSIDAGICNGRYFANGAGIGFDAKVTRIARSIRLPIGQVVYLFAVLRALIGSIATPSVQIEADGMSWNRPMTLASISNGPYVGGMFHVAPGANNDDQALDLVMVEPVNRRRILALLPKLIDGEHLAAPEVTRHSITRMTLVADEPLPSQLDGEVQPLQSRFEIEILPGALNLL